MYAWPLAVLKHCAWPLCSTLLSHCSASVQGCCAQSGASDARPVCSATSAQRLCVGCCVYCYDAAKNSRSCLSSFFGCRRQMAMSPALRVMAAANDKVTHPTDAGCEARRQRKGQKEEAERRWKWPSRRR